MRGENQIKNNLIQFLNKRFHGYHHIFVTTLSCDNLLKRTGLVKLARRFHIQIQVDRRPVFLFG
jgi:hypothetical protein